MQLFGVTKTPRLDFEGVSAPAIVTSADALD